MMFRNVTHLANRTNHKGPIRTKIDNNLEVKTELLAVVY